MAFTFCSSGAAIIKAGANSNDNITVSGAALNTWSNQVEGRIVIETRKNYLTDFNSLVSGAQQLLSEVASSLIAIKIINYDMSEYSSRAEAITMMNVLDDQATKGINILKDFKAEDIKSVA